MKNFNLIEWLQTDSHGKQSATRDHHGTKSRELPGNPRPLRYLCATLALRGNDHPAAHFGVRGDVGMNKVERMKT